MSVRFYWDENMSGWNESWNGQLQLQYAIVMLLWKTFSQEVTFLILIVYILLEIIFSYNILHVLDNTKEESNHLVNPS
jgi:hypothetical protein